MVQENYVCLFFVPNLLLAAVWSTSKSLGELYCFQNRVKQKGSRNHPKIGLNTMLKSGLRLDLYNLPRCFYKLANGNWGEYGLKFKLAWSHSVQNQWFFNRVGDRQCLWLSSMVAHPYHPNSWKSVFGPWNFHYVATTKIISCPLGVMSDVWNQDASDGRHV